MFNKVYTILLSTSLLLVAAPNSNKKESKKYTISKKAKKIIKKDENKKIKEHTVVSGDTIFSIARKYKVSISDIYKLNKLRPGATIYPGDKLKIPLTGYAQSAQKAVEKNKKTVYKIKKGDTLYSIAKKFNMKLEDLLKLNKLTKKSILKPGNELTVYAPKKTLEKRKLPTKHIVKKGDTLWSIAKKYNLSLKEIKLLNPKVKTKGLKKGMILKVSKKEAIKLAKLAKKRKNRLKGVLAKYKTKKRYSYKGYDGGNRRIVNYAKRFLGTRYVWGASRPGAFDCSGFTQYVFKRVKGKVIPRISRRQAYYGMYVPRSRLIGGDLVFFDTSRRRRGYVNHVGIYIGNSHFIHASSAKHRVVITSLNKPFYRQRFMWGRRIN
jgi:cell wall-associated NlpC family hydrolase